MEFFDEICDTLNNLDVCECDICADEMSECSYSIYLTGVDASWLDFSFGCHKSAIDAWDKMLKIAEEYLLPIEGETLVLYDVMAGSVLGEITV